MFLVSSSPALFPRKANVTQEHPGQSQRMPNEALLIDAPLIDGCEDHLPADSSYAERRRGFRIRQARPIKVYDPAANRYLGGRTHDVSTTGLRIELPRFAPVRQGHVINVHVGLNEHGQSLANRRQMLPARIVWVDREHSEDSSVILAGVEFVSSIAAHLDAA